MCRAEHCEQSSEHGGSVPDAKLGSRPKEWAYGRGSRMQNAATAAHYCNGSKPVRRRPSNVFSTRAGLARSSESVETSEFSIRIQRRDQNAYLLFCCSRHCLCF